MIVSIRELSTSILLYSPDTQVVSIVIWELWENGQYVELSALGVLFIITLFVLVLVAHWLGKKYGSRTRDICDLSFVILGRLKPAPTYNRGPAQPTYVGAGCSRPIHDSRFTIHD